MASTFPLDRSPDRGSHVRLAVAVAGSLLLHVALTVLPARTLSLSGRGLEPPPASAISALLVTTETRSATAPAETAGVTAEILATGPAPDASPPPRSDAGAAPMPSPLQPPVAVPALPLDRPVFSAPPLVRGRVSSNVVSRAVTDYQGLVAAHADAIAPYRRSGADVPPQVPPGFRPAFPVPMFESGLERQLGAVVLLRADGRVDDVLIDLNIEAFRDAVDSAVRATQFIPATRAGVPVAGWLVLRFDFLIQGSEPDIRTMVDEAVPRR